VRGWARWGDRCLALQALVAIDLHDYYTAAETLFERVARLLDGDVPGGDRWHRDLLQQMATDLLPPGAKARQCAGGRGWSGLLLGARGGVGVASRWAPGRH